MNTTSESARQIKGILKPPAAHPRDSSASGRDKNLSWEPNILQPNWTSARDIMIDRDRADKAGKDGSRVNFWTYDTLDPYRKLSQRIDDPTLRLDLTKRPTYLPRNDLYIASASSSAGFSRKDEPLDHLVEPSRPYIVESDNKDANYIDYRHYPPYELRPGPYRMTSEYLNDVMRYGNRPPESWVHGLSGSWRRYYYGDPIADPLPDHHFIPHPHRKRSRTPSSRRRSRSSSADRVYMEDRSRELRRTPELHHHPGYYGPDFVNYRHALARHPSLIDEVDYKTFYHKLYEDSGKFV